MSDLGEVLVTGGAGFIGCHLVERLVAAGKEVTVFDNSWRGSQKNLESVKNDIKFIEGDIRDYESVKNATAGIDTVFHLASIQGTKFFYEYPDLVLEVGVLGNINIAKAAKENNIKRVIFTSSSEVYAQPNIFPTPETHPLTIPDSKNPRWSYSATKIIGEIIFLNYAKKYGFDTTIIRIHNAYGPRMGWQHVIPEFVRRLVLGDKFIVQGDGSETRSFCYISDIVDGLMLAAFEDGGKNEIFNLGNDNEEYKISDMITLLSQVSKKKIIPLFSMPRFEGSTPRRVPDITRARTLLNYNPKIGFKNGLELTYRWYKREIESIIATAEPKNYPWIRQS